MKLNFNGFFDALSNGRWGTKNYRPIKSALFNILEKEVKNFRPLNNLDDNNYPIQLLDFFSGAGGTSLGFAAINSVFPTFKLLGGIDINAASAESYRRYYFLPRNI